MEIALDRGSYLLLCRELNILYNNFTEDKIKWQQVEKKLNVLNQEFFPLQNSQVNNIGESDMGFQKGRQFWMESKASKEKSVWEVGRETSDPRVTSLGALKSARSAKWTHKM